MIRDLTLMPTLHLPRILLLALLLVLSSCQSTSTVTPSDTSPANLDVRITVNDTDTPPDGKNVVAVQFFFNGTLVRFAAGETVICNGIPLLFNVLGAYEGRVPVVPVGGAYTFVYTRNNVATTVSATVPPRPVFVFPTQGRYVALGNSIAIKYVSGNGAGVDAGASDGVTAVRRNIFEPDNGLYTGLDVSPLRSGPGSLWLTRKFETTPSGTAFRSLRITYYSFSTIPVTWQPTVDEVLARCPTAAEIAAVNAKLTLSFEADPTAGTLVCTAAAGSADLTHLQERTYQGVLMMRRLEFDAPLPWTGQPLYTWFTNAIRGIRIRGDIQDSFCCSPPNVINIWAANNSLDLLTNRWADPQVANGGLRDALLLYVHEARHSDGKWHTCPGGSDDTLAELGAWGVQYHLLLLIADHGDTNFMTSAQPNAAYYRDNARSYADDLRRTRICNP